MRSPFPVKRLSSLALSVCAGSLLGGCGGGGGSGGGPTGVPGTETPKPGGGTFFLDFHHQGQANHLHLAESYWGRLVDVHGLDAAGAVDPVPAFRDMLINETVVSDGLDFRLETNPITQRTRLVILRRRGAPDEGDGTFETLLARSRALLTPIVPKPDDGSQSGPISFVARNSCLSLRFDDLLDDTGEAPIDLLETVRIVSGYPPSMPFLARVIFDPNHGGIWDGEFHSTRVLIDTTVSLEESLESAFPLEINALGLPASFIGDARPNVSVRIATRKDAGSGQFHVLTNLAGTPLDQRGNGPMDGKTPTRDIVRALRAGRGDDGNNGFLLDLNRPELIGSWPIVIDSAVTDPAGSAGFDFLVALTFTGPCRRGPRTGDILQVGEIFLEVSEASSEPNIDGEVLDVRARVSGSHPLQNAGGLLGTAAFLSTFADGLIVPAPCWVNVVPPPSLPPDRGIQAESRFVLRFSEPMAPSSLEPFDNLRLKRGNAGSSLRPTTLVVSEVLNSRDLRTITLRPLLPLSQGTTGEYTLDLGGGEGGLVDLAGNLIAGVPGSLEFELDPLVQVPENGGIALRFSSADELEPIGAPDVRGQFLFDFLGGSIRGRPVAFESFSADRSRPVPSIMIPFGPGVQTPLSGLGSKLQTVWRHCDVGWVVEDESKHNIDVIGLAWTPVGGVVTSDFFERFEIRLAHSRRLPDEFRTFVGTNFPCSGLGAGNNVCPPCRTNIPFEDNILRDPRSPQTIVHDRSLGYRVEPRDLFVGRSGATLMPYPLNRNGGPFTSFTWRDTSVLAKDGEDGGGIPLLIEVNVPLQVVPGPPGHLAEGGFVPAWGLPLLIEVRCFPSVGALGFNPVEIYLAQNSQALPNFRAYSTGGIDDSGMPVQVNPDLTLIPEGGFNPMSRPPGGRTLFQSDNSFYSGQLETVVRVSRAHTIWMQSELASPHYLPPIVSPQSGDQSGNSRIELEFRGADGFSGAGPNKAFDAHDLDPLGDIGPNEVQFHANDPSWSADLERLAGAQFLQMRITFVNDIVAGVGPELSAVGIAQTSGP